MTERRRSGDVSPASRCGNGRKDNILPSLNDNKEKLKKYVKVLQGKEYLQVGGRVWSAHNSRQLISITTTLEETEKYYRVKAVARVLNTHFDDFGNVIEDAKIGTYTGHAQSLKVGGQSAEKTNPLEVAETSAIGRALGFAGFGDLESIASFEEVEVAYSRRNSTVLPTPATPKTELDLLKRQLGKLLTEKKGITKQAEADAEADKRFRGKKASQLSKEEIEKWIDDLNEPEPEMNEIVPF